MHLCVCVCVYGTGRCTLCSCVASRGLWLAVVLVVTSFTAAWQKEKKNTPTLPKTCRSLKRAEHTAYSRLLSHSRGQRTCKLRRAREAVTSDWPSDEKRPLASITFALVFNKSNQKGKKKKRSLLLHSCRTPVAHVLTSHQRRERGAGRNTIKDGGVFL